jgi:hypothetical protein
VNGLVDGTSIEVGNDGPDATGGLGLFDFSFSRRRSLLQDVDDPTKTAASHQPVQRAQDWDENGANDDYGSFVLADHDDMDYMPATTAIPDLHDDEDYSMPDDWPQDSPVPAQGYRPPPPPPGQPGQPPPTAREQAPPPGSLVRYGIDTMNMENIVTFWTQHNRCSDTRMTADNLVRSLQVFADASQVSFRTPHLVRPPALLHSMMLQLIPSVQAFPGGGVLSLVSRSLTNLRLTPPARLPYTGATGA